MEHTQITGCNYENIISQALAENTRLIYEKGWSRFSHYCNQLEFNPLAATPDNVAEFFIHIATIPQSHSGNVLSLGTILLYSSAINNKFNSSGIPSPAQHPKVKSVLRGLSRTLNSKPRRVKALREHHIKNILTVCDKVAIRDEKKLISLRDAALISIGFAGALRRSEICNLKVEDIELISTNETTFDTLSDDCNRMYLHIRESKTDQIGHGQKIPLINGKYLSPIDRLRIWLKESKITDGYVFVTMRRGGSLRGNQMHHSDIPRIVKYYARKIGLDPKEFSGHSLRAGFVTSAAVHHARLDKIMEVTRHTNPATVLKYVRDVDSFQNHAGHQFL